MAKGVLSEPKNCVPVSKPPVPPHQPLLDASDAARPAGICPEKPPPSFISSVTM